MEVDPNSMEAYFWRGIAYEAKKENDKALADFNRALELNPKRAANYIWRAIVYADQKAYDLAIADLNQALTLEPRYGWAYYHRGRVLVLQGNLEQALDDLDWAVTIDPFNSQAFFERGEIHLKKKNYDISISDFSKVIGVESKNYQAYYLPSPGLPGFGRGSQRPGGFAEVQRAETAGQREVKYSRHSVHGRCSPPPVISPGDLHLKRKLEGTMSDFFWGVQAEVRLGRGFSVFILFLLLTTAALFPAGMPSSAWGEPPSVSGSPAVDFQKPLTAQDYFKMGQLSASLDNGIRYLSKAIEMNPDYAEAYLRRGQRYLGKKQYDKALADFTKAISLNPRQAEYHVSRADAYLLQKQYEPALPDLNQAIALDSQNFRAYLNRGKVYVQQGNLEQALKDFDQAIRLRPREAGPFYERGRVHLTKKAYG